MATLVLASLLAPAYHQTGDALFVTTQVAALKDGHIRLPPGVNITDLAVEMGCSDLNTLDEQLLPQAPNTFLISFEPMVDKYAVLLSRAAERFYVNSRKLPSNLGEVVRKQNHFSPIGQHHPRGMVLPFAVSEAGGPATFHVSRTAGCSSLLAVNPKATYNKFCKSIAEDRTVDTISMAQAMALLPPDLPIRLLKLDVQGMDTRLIKSIPPDVLARIDSIRFETAVPGARCGGTLYEGTQSCASVVPFLRKHGFDGGCPNLPPPWCEGDARFYRPGKSPVEQTT